MMKTFTEIFPASAGPLAVSLCFAPLMVKTTQTVEFDSAAINFRIAAISGFLVSIPSLTNLACCITSCFLYRTGTPPPGVGLISEEMFIFLIGSSLFAVLCFIPSSVHQEHNLKLLQSIGNASTICSIIPLVMYLQRTASIDRKAALILTILVCFGSILSSVALCFNTEGTVHSSISLISSCLIVSSGVFYIGVFAYGVYRFVSKTVDSSCMSIIPPSFGIFCRNKNVGPEELLSRIEIWNSMMIPALHMLILLFNFILKSIWYFVPVAVYTQCLWANFVLTVCVLLIEKYLINDTVNRGLLAMQSTVKKSYLRYISHEIRTPVNAMSIGVRLLLENTKRAHTIDTDKLELLECMESACTVTVDMLNDILTMDKIGTKTMEIRKQLVGAEQFVTEALKLFLPSAREKNIDLLISLSNTSEGARCLEPNDSINIDVFKMRQVLRNVVSNGIKFSPPGGRVEVCVGVVSKKGHESLRITVKDSGSGMDSVSKDKIFKSAFQYKPELLQGGGGSGLGLMISREIVDAHEGSIALYSEGLGHGSTITLHLPMPETDPLNERLGIRVDIDNADVVEVGEGGSFEIPMRMLATSLLTSPKETTIMRASSNGSDLIIKELPGDEMGVDARGSAAIPVSVLLAIPDIKQSESAEGIGNMSQLLKFLVVDDSSSCRKMQVRAIRSFVKDFGLDVEVCEANDGVEAVLAVATAEAAGASFDIVFIDGNMPNLNGPAAVSQIRRSGFTKSIIGVTGNALDYEVAEFMTSGATAIWTKPIEMSKLKAAIKEAAQAAVAATREPQSAQDCNDTAELKARLALKRAALQLATANIDELQKAYDIQKQSVHLLTEQKAAIALTLLNIRLQAAAESAEHERIIATQKQTLETLVKDSKHFVERDLTMKLTKSLSEKERVLAAAKAAESSRTELDAAIKFRQAAFADASKRTAKAWALSELNAQVALKVSEDSILAAQSLGEKDRGLALLQASSDAKIALASAVSSLKAAWNSSEINTSEAWALSELNSKLALQVFEERMSIALELSEPEVRCSLAAAAEEARRALAAVMEDRDAAFSLSARNSAQAWSLSEFNTQTAAKTSFDAKSAALSMSEGDRDAAEARHASQTAHARELSEDKIAIASKLAESSKNIFIARLMHEIRTPLYVIAAALSDDRVAPTAQDLAMLRRHSSILQRAMDNYEFAASVDKILPRRVATLSCVNVKDFIRAQIAEATYLSLIGPADVDVIYDDAPEAIVTDVELLQRALRPLLSNAFEHRVPGSNVKVGVSCGVEGVLRLQVSNTSLLDFTAPKLYSMFHSDHPIQFETDPDKDELQLNSTKGLGLGLFTSDKSIRALNSTLEIECTPSSPPCSFHVSVHFDLSFTKATEAYDFRAFDLVTHTCLFMDSPRLRPISDAGVVSPEYPAFRTILVVDDSPICCKLLMKILMESNFVCESAKNGEEALAILSVKTFAAIFMDLRMPVKDGLQATREARALGITTPIIALSAESSQEVKDEAKGAGVDAFIVKPARAERILAELLNQLYVSPGHSRSFEVKSSYTEFLGITELI